MFEENFSAWLYLSLKAASVLWLSLLTHLQQYQAGKHIQKCVTVCLYISEILLCASSNRWFCFKLEAVHLIETLILFFWHIMIYCQIYKINFCFRKILHTIFQLRNILSLKKLLCFKQNLYKLTAEYLFQCSFLTVLAKIWADSLSYSCIFLNVHEKYKLISSSIPWSLMLQSHSIRNAVLPWSMKFLRCLDFTAWCFVNF